MRLSSIILVATATLVVSYSTVSAAPGSKISAVASDATPPKNARFLRSFKTEEGDEDDKLESGKEERGGYPFLVPESATIEMGKRIEDSWLNQLMGKVSHITSGKDILKRWNSEEGEIKSLLKEADRWKGTPERSVFKVVKTELSYL